MGRYNAAIEAGKLVAVFFILTRIIPKKRTRALCKLLGLRDTDSDSNHLIICTAFSLQLVCRKWLPSNKVLLFGVLLVKLLNIFAVKTFERVALIFLPVCAFMWPRFPRAAAGLDSTLHPQFVSTMSALCGLGSKDEMAKFGETPEIARDFSSSRWVANGVRSTSWSLRALSLAYCTQGLLKARGEWPHKAEVIVEALYRAIPSCLIYTTLSQYSVLAYSILGAKPNGLGSLPSLMFFLEPIGRMATLAEYYTAHFVFMLVQDLRRVPGGEIVARLIEKVGPFVTTLSFLFASHPLPALPLLRKIAP